MSDNNPSAYKCISAIAFTLISSLLFSGTLFRWAPLVQVLKADGVFSHLCEDSDLIPNNHTDDDAYHNTSGLFPSCKKQDHRLDQAFQMSLILYSIIGFPVGLFFDRFGLLCTRLLTSLLVIAGYVLLAYAAPGNSSWYVYIGEPLIAITCCVYFISNSYVAKLSKKCPCTITTFYFGAMNLSSLVFYYIKSLNDIGYAPQITLVILASMASIDIINSLFFLPWKKVTKLDEWDGKQRSHELIEMIQEDTQGNDYIVIPAAGESLANITFVSSIKTWTFFLHALWFIFLHLRLMTFLITFNEWLRIMTHDDSKIMTNFKDIFWYLQVGSIFISPIPGMIMDFQSKKYKGERKFPSEIKGLIPLMITSILATMMSISDLCHSELSVYFTIVLFEMTWIFAYGSAAAFMVAVFPGHHFGKLFGLVYTLGGIVMLLPYPLMQEEHGQDQFDHVNFMELFASLLSFIHPLYIWWTYGTDKLKYSHSTSTSN